MHSTSGPSRPLDSRTNRGFSAPHTSQETYGFEFSIQLVDYGGQLRQFHKNNRRNWPRLTRGKLGRPQMPAEPPPNPPRSHLRFRTILHFSTFPFFFLPCELLGRATGVIERCVPLRKYRTQREFADVRWCVSRSKRLF